MPPSSRRLARDRSEVPGRSAWAAQMRVLVVEDEVRLAETVRRGLANQGCVADVVYNGVDGLWAAEETSYDVIVLDIMLPGLNGYRVIEQLREKGIWTPVLMLTAKDGEYDQADAFDLGADDYLTKPFSFVVLMARLRALIRRGAPERPVVLAAGDLTLDPARRRVGRGESEIQLTPREFGLLEFLLHHRGDVVSKTEILDGVWDAAYEGDPNVVEVYVRYLRLKIDAPFGRQAIETVRGVGYRLAADGG
jgi:DNA-binding response OmpR family regulator